MKTLRLISMFFICAALSAGFASCGDDDDEDPIVNPLNPDNSGNSGGGGNSNSVFQIQTGNSSDVTDNSAMLSGSFTTTKGQPDKIGFLVGTSSNLSIANNEYDLQVDGITSSFSKSVTGLKQLTTYYYRAYALFEDKYYYGDAKSFTTEKEKEALAKISLVSRNGTSLKVKYEISSEVDYYYCGKGTSISQTTKYTAEKTLTYSELKPGQDYTFTVIAYTKDGKKNDPIRATFSTSTSPYTNYLCIDGDFYPFTGVTMTTDYDYTAVNGTGTNWKILYLYLSGDEFVQFRYGVHQWESVTTSWSSGTYKITDSSSYYSYNGWFYNGSRADWFYEGNLKIQKSGSSYVFDFECEGNKKYIGHVEANS